MNIGCTLPPYLAVQLSTKYGDFTWSGDADSNGITVDPGTDDFDVIPDVNCFSNFSA